MHCQAMDHQYIALYTLSRDGGCTVKTADNRFTTTVTMVSHQYTVQKVVK